MDIGKLYAQFITRALRLMYTAECVYYFILFFPQLRFYVEICDIICLRHCWILMKNNEKCKQTILILLRDFSFATSILSLVHTFTLRTCRTDAACTYCVSTKYFAFNLHHNFVDSSRLFIL